MYWQGETTSVLLGAVIMMGYSASAVKVEVEVVVVVV
jgi:hypothetical protein